MKTRPASRHLIVPNVVLVAVLLACNPGLLKAADRHLPRVNRYAAPVVDAKGHRVTYDRKSLEAMARKTDTRQTHSGRGAAVFEPHRLAPLGAQTQQPFWNYAVFGADIGSTNIIIAPAAPRADA